MEPLSAKPAECLSSAGIGPRSDGPGARTAIEDFEREKRLSDPKIAASAAIARAQASLEQAVAELDKLPALDGRSIALTAHALNNFLTVSVAVVDLLLEVLRDHPNRQVQAWLESLSHSSDLMTHTVSQLMSNSTGEISLRWEDIELPRLVEKACAYYRRHAAQKHIELRFSAASDVPIVRTDRVVVAVVLDNLLSNAVKYSPGAKRIWVQVHAERGGVACSVRDEGPGLSSEEQTRLFLPGVRLGPVPSAGEPSSGYGLAIAKRFMDQLGGELRCESTSGLGATFSFWLPAVESDRRVEKRA
ncbi:MAG TPA: HAMP domain-containing sensor histidine kinase [Actinomycetota bacterium]|nr:HAMP domain-containing sensor histidine kinase [Actinomycetota bacterium]